MLRATASFSAVILDGRPPLRPRARAAARPAIVRSRINARSNSASAPNKVEDELAASGAGVDPFGERAEADLPLLKVGDDLDQVAQTAPEPVEPPDHDGVTLAEMVEHPGKLGSCVERSTRLLLEDASTTSFLQRVKLEGKILIGTTHPGVSDQIRHLLQGSKNVTTTIVRR